MVHGLRCPRTIIASVTSTTTTTTAPTAYTTAPMSRLHLDNDWEALM